VKPLLAQLFTEKKLLPHRGFSVQWNVKEFVSVYVRKSENMIWMREGTRQGGTLGVVMKPMDAHLFDCYITYLI
jgi:hypothetical protein